MKGKGKCMQSILLEGMEKTSLDSPNDVTDDYAVAEDVIPGFSFNVVAARDL